MKYFIDMEFNESGRLYPLELISIGIADEDGREFYRINNNFNSVTPANDWVMANVVPQLTLIEGDNWRDIPMIAADILEFIGDDPSPEFWGYFCDYDWVIFCQLFGDMGQKPPNFPYYCHDLRQALDEELRTDVSQPDDDYHNALLDARWIRKTWVSVFDHRGPEGNDARLYRSEDDE